MPDQSPNSEPGQRTRLQRIAAWWMRPRIVIAGIILFVIVGGPYAYRGYWISRVPWIEDPFDIKAMQDVKVRDEDNALEDYRQAVSSFVELNFGAIGEWLDEWHVISVAKTTGSGIAPPAAGNIHQLCRLIQEHGWDQRPEAVEKWLDDNRVTLDHWKRGASKPDYQYFHWATINPEKGDPFLSKPMSRASGGIYGLAALTCLEAMRLHAGRDAEAAWNLLLVNLQAGHHLSRHGQLSDAQDAESILWVTQQSIKRWAQEPDVDARLLRKALSDFATEELRRANIAQTALRMDYGHMMPFLNGGILRFVGTSAGPDTPWIGVSYLFLHGEPQVTGRTMRHLMASVVPEAAKERPARQPAIGPHKLYEPSASHSVAHATTAEMERFMEQALGGSTPLNEYLDFSDQVDTEHQLLCIALALELFKREHGEYPERLEQLSTVVPSIKLADIFAMPPALLHYDRGPSFARVWSVGVNGIDDGGDINRGVWQDIGFVLGKPPERATE